MDDKPDPVSSRQNRDDQPVTRESLYALVWSEPMVKVAERFGVSSSYMARVCTALNVPRPARGYWAKLAVGKALPPSPLPEPTPGDETVWSPGGALITTPRPLPRARASHATQTRKIVHSGSALHPLLQGVKPHFESGRLSWEAGYLKPAKKLLPDLIVTKNALDKATDFASKLFRSLEASGHRVVIAPHSEQFRRADVDERENSRGSRHFNNLWSPWRCTVVYVGTVAIGMTIIEMSEEVEARYVNGEYIRARDYVSPKRRYAVDHPWTTKKAFATSRLCLQAYSPYWLAKWVREWTETNDPMLSTRIASIVKDLEHAAVEIARLVEQGQRQAELERRRRAEEHARWLEEEAERRAAKAIKDSRAELLRIIDDWAEAKRLEQFFSDAAQEAHKLGEDERQRILERLRRARELIGPAETLRYFLDWKSPDEREA